MAERGILNVAFSPELIDAEENSRPIALSDGRIVVVRKAGYEAPTSKALETVADEIRTELKQEGARARALALAEQVMDEAATIASADELSALADKHELSYRTVGAVTRDSENVNAAVLRQLFTLPPPAEGALRV